MTKLTPAFLAPIDVGCKIFNDVRTSVLECEVLSLISEEELGSIPEGERNETSESNTVAENVNGSTLQGRVTGEALSDQCTSPVESGTDERTKRLRKKDEETFDESGYMVPNVRLTADDMTALTSPASLIDSDDDLKIFRLTQQDSCVPDHGSESKDGQPTKRSIDILTDPHLSTSADGQISSGACSTTRGACSTTRGARLQTQQKDNVIDESGYMVPDVLMEEDGGGSGLSVSGSLRKNGMDEILHVDIRDRDCFVSQTDDNSTGDIHHTYHDSHQVDNSSDAIHHTYHVSHAVNNSREDIHHTYHVSHELGSSRDDIHHTYHVSHDAAHSKDEINHIYHDSQNADKSRDEINHTYFGLDDVLTEQELQSLNEINAKYVKDSKLKVIDKTAQSLNANAPNEPDKANDKVIDHIYFTADDLLSKQTPDDTHPHDDCSEANDSMDKLKKQDPSKQSQNCPSQKKSNSSNLDESGYLILEETKL